MIENAYNGTRSQNQTRYSNITSIIFNFYYLFQGPFEIQFCGNCRPASLQNVWLDERISNKKAGKCNYNELWYLFMCIFRNARIYHRLCLILKCNNTYYINIRASFRITKESLFPPLSIIFHKSEHKNISQICRSNVIQQIIRSILEQLFIQIFL